MSELTNPPQWHGSDLEPVIKNQLTPQRRQELQRQGRLDGWSGVPDPSLVLHPVTTPARSEILRTMEEAIAQAELIFERRLAGHMRERSTLTAHIDAWHVELAEINKLLATMNGFDREDDGTPRRRAGEKDRSDEFVRDRREREQSRGRRQWERRRIQISQSIDGATHRIGEVDGEVRALEVERVKFTEWIAATFVLATAIYDTALLRHHALGEFVRPLLSDAREISRRILARRENLQ